VEGLFDCFLFLNPETISAIFRNYDFLICFSVLNIYFFYVFLCLFLYLFICLFVYKLFVYLFICLFVYFFISFFLYLSIYLFFSEIFTRRSTRSRRDWRRRRCRQAEFCDSSDQ
jgi:hypothetical protein